MTPEVQPLLTIRMLDLAAVVPLGTLTAASVILVSLSRIEELLQPWSMGFAISFGLALVCGVSVVLGTVVLVVFFLGVLYKTLASRRWTWLLVVIFFNICGAALAHAILRTSEDYRSA